MILAASFEFHKKRNAEIVERYTDSEEVRLVRCTLYFNGFYNYNYNEYIQNTFYCNVQFFLCQV